MWCTKPSPSPPQWLVVSTDVVYESLDGIESNSSHRQTYGFRSFIKSGLTRQQPE